MSSACFAQFNLVELPAIFYLAVRVVVAVVAGLITWLLAGPLAAIFCRMITGKDISNTFQGFCRLVVTVGVAVLAFWLIPIGPGWGPGLGPGLGAGLGPGQGAGDGKNGSNTSTKPNGSTDGKASGKSMDEKPNLSITLVPRDSPDADNEKYYLIQGKGPAKTIKEIGSFLEETKGQWKGDRLEIILYKDSFNYKDIPVRMLEEQWARPLGLNPYIPKKYFSEDRPAPTAGG